MMSFKLKEADLLKTVIEMAHVFKWRVAHFRTSMNQRGQWLTAVQAEGAGFPDLVLARNGQVIFVELKSDKGKLTSEQEIWLELLNGYVWRPCDLNKIERILR